MAVTIHDLARMTGLNASTVSRALRNDRRVKPATRERIQELARRKGYVPNLPARQLAAGKTGNIWFCFGSPDADIERETAVELDNRFDRAGYDLQIVLHSNQPERFRRRLEKLSQQAADAAVIIPPATPRHAKDTMRFSKRSRFRTSSSTAIGKTASRRW